MNDESSKYPPRSEPGGVIAWTGDHGDDTQAASVLGFRLESYVATSGPDAGKFGVSARYGDDDDWYPVTALHSDIGAALMEAHLWVLGQATDFVGSMTASQPAEQPRGEKYPAVFTGRLLGKHVGLHGSVDSVEALEAYIDAAAKLYTAQPKPEQDHSRDATKMIGQAGCAHTVPVCSAPRCDAPGCNCATWMPEGCAWDGVEPEQAVGDGVVAELRDLAKRWLDDAPLQQTRPIDQVAHARSQALRECAFSLDCILDRTAPRPAVATPAQAVAYLDIGAGGYTDLGSDLSPDQLAKLPKGRHLLGIIGTYGIDGYTEATPAEVTDDTQEYVLRAMAENYTEGHSWDKLDAAACMRGADEIKALRAALTAQCQVRKDGQGVGNFGNERRFAPVERERFEAWMKRGGANIDKRPDGVYADHSVMCCWNSWWMSASFNTDTSFTTVPYALADVVHAVRRFDECAEDGEDVDISRDWFDALTTIGLLRRIQRSPALWEMTDAGRSLLDLASPSAGAVVPDGWKLVPAEPTTEMRSAFQADKPPLSFARTTVFIGDFGERYAALLAAAPEVTQS